MARAADGLPKALLTHSGTGALELAALLADVGPGDEVIVPSFTFVSTANAFVLRGAVPVFVDIRADTLNLDETLIEDAITPRTKAIVPVHYAGVGCEMNAVMEVARPSRRARDRGCGPFPDRDLQGPAARNHRRARHPQHPRDEERALRGGRCAPDSRIALGRRGRRSFTRREPTAAGSSAERSTSTRGSTSARRYPPSEVNAAYLWAQLEASEWISRDADGDLGALPRGACARSRPRGVLRRPTVPADRRHAAHMLLRARGGCACAATPCSKGSSTGA